MSKKKIKVSKQIREASKSLKDLMYEQLSIIGDNMIQQVIGRAKNAMPSERLNAIKDIHPRGIQDYTALLREAMAALASDALDVARRQVPKARNVKLAEFDNLPPDLQRKIKTRLDLLIGKQVGDLQKVIEFAYAHNEDTTDDIAVLQQDLQDSAVGWLDGTSVQAGSDITAATVIADARSAFFDEPDVSDQIAGYVFMNGDPISDICQDMVDNFGPDSGNLIAKDDPNLFRYTPPLHWNCKSWIEPVLAGNEGDKDVTPYRPSTAKLDNSIQFEEATTFFHQCRLDETDK